MVDWYEVLKSERREFQVRREADARMLGRLAFLLDRPGMVDTIRRVLDDGSGSGYPNEAFGQFLVQWQAWPWGPGIRPNGEGVVAAPVPPSLGEALGRLAEAGRFVVGWPQAVDRQHRDRLQSAGLIEPTAEVPGFQLTEDGRNWCERHADIETRVRAIHGRARRADPGHLWLELADLRAAMAEGDPVPWNEVTNTIVTMHRAGVVALFDSATVTGQSAGSGLSVPGEDGPCDLIVVAIEVPRATPAADPLLVERREVDEVSRARLGTYARALDALPARRRDEGGVATSSVEV
jgi:hypothetical protein